MYLFSIVPILRNKWTTILLFMHLEQDKPFKGKTEKKRTFLLQQTGGDTVTIHLH